jgi:ABC-type spermidine/putrescine transport system permease subunit I
MAQRPAELTALLQPEYTVQNYIDFFRFPLYYTVLWDSFVIGIMVTILTLLLAYPIAYYLAFVAGDRKFLFMVLIILPFWINLVVRTFAWQLILSPRGLINYILYDLTSIFESRQNLAFSRNAIVVGLVHVFLPYMVIPIYTSLDRIDQSHVEAAKNLGANRIEAFYEVTLPQSLPGASAGVVMVFVLAFGSFVVPQLLGGAEDMMIANLIGGMFGQLNNWPLGAAMSVLFLATSLLLVYLFNRAVELDELYGGEEGEA